MTKFLGCPGIEIADESRMNRARIIYNHWRITKISRTSTQTSKYNAVFHEHSTHARCMNHRRSASKHACLSNVPRTSTFVPRWTWYVRGDMKGGRQWTDVDVRGFEPVSTHKHWRPTRVPRIVTHTWRIHYAHRLMHIFNRSKLKITHKPSSKHIHLQSLTVHVRSTNELRIRRTLHADTKICA